MYIFVEVCIYSFAYYVVGYLSNECMFLYIDVYFCIFYCVILTLISNIRGHILDIRGHILEKRVHILNNWVHILDVRGHILVRYWLKQLLFKKQAF